MAPRPARRSPSRLRGGAVGSLVFSALLAGCAAATATPPAVSPDPIADASSASPDASAAADTPWQRELDDLQPDGTRTLESALRLFAMAFGPIPGVDAQRAAPGTVDSASDAVRVVRAHLATLPEEQRRAIEQDLAAPAGGDTIELTAPPVGGVNARLASFHGDDPRATGSGPTVASQGYGSTFLDEITREATRAHEEAARDFGEMPMLRVRLNNWPDDPFITFFIPNSGGCDVFLNTATADVDRFMTRRSMTLDIVHCYQSWFMGSDAGFDGDVPAWAWNGPAEYLVLSIWPPTTEYDNLSWSRYLTSPDLPLTRRSYDAIGFFAQARDKHLDPAAAFKAVLTEGDDAARFAAMGATAPAFLDAWASGLARTWTGDWIFDGPGIPGTSVDAPREPLAMANDGVEAISQPAYSNHLYALHSTADILEFDLAGHGRLGDGTVDSTELGPGYFCTTDHGCGPCPDGSDPSVHPTALAPDSVLAVSGATDGTTGSVSGHALEEYCRASPTPTSQAVQVKDIRTIGGHQVTFVDMIACDGPWGHWTGRFYGIEDDSRPMDFDMGGGSGDVTVTTTPGTAATPKGVISVSGDVDVTIKDAGTTMVLSGTTDVVFEGPSGPLPPDHNPFSVSYQIEPADPGRCP